MEFDPIRETLTWEPKEPIHVFSNVFRVGFFAVFLKEDIKFATNGPKLNAKPIRKPDAITMTLSSESGEWQFLNFHDFTVVYDGQRKDFRDLEHHGDVFAGGVSEAFFPEFTYAEFRALSLAKSVKAELGDLPFDLSYKDRETMRAFVNYFDLEFKSTLNDSALPP
jgi:hypothetical protein